MRHMVAFLIGVGLFMLVVGGKFKQSDAEKLAAAARVAAEKIRGVMPPLAKLAGPVNALRSGIPTTADDRVRARLETDKLLAGQELTVTSDGATVKIRGVVPSAEHRRRAGELAGTTAGVEQVVNEIAVPE